MDDCPFQQGGACLEAFDDPTDCPNTSSTLLDPIDFRDLDAELEQPINALPGQFVTFGTGESMGLSQANDLRAERPCRLILLAGEVKAGKSTLLTEFFGKFLKDSYQGWDFAGSETLTAFDRVHAPSRSSSGALVPDTARTADEGMRFLHLGLRSGARTDLILSELSGEKFKGVIDGGSIKDQVPIAAVADRCLVLVNGSLLSTASTRSRAFSRAKRLVGGLTESDGIPLNTPTLILATKADLWRPSAEAEVHDELDALVAFGRERGLDVTWQDLAARPVDDLSQEVGMPEVTAWMLTDDADPVKSTAPSPASGRRFWQDRND